MKNTRILSIGLIGLMVIGTTFTSCRKKGCTDSAATNYDAKAKKDDGTCEYPVAATDSGYHVMLKFSHNYDGTDVTPSDFNDIKYTNQLGTNHSITHMQYLISDVRFYTADGDSIVFDGYNFIDFDNTNSFAYSLGADNHLPAGNYTGIAFRFGFDEEDNISGAYPDLNAASWSWPEMIGGGYHYMKFEGRFIDSNTDTSSFQYHMGTDREITSTDTLFHNNSFLAVLPNSAFTLSNDASIEVKMNIAEWFKNPYTWDLNQYSSMLMPNHNAQVLMNDNGPSVFSLGTIDQ